MRDKKEGNMVRFMISLRKEEMEWVNKKSGETEATMSGVIRLVIKKEMALEKSDAKAA